MPNFVVHLRFLIPLILLSFSSPRIASAEAKQSQKELRSIILKSKDYRKRSDAALKLARFNSTLALKTLIVALEDKHWMVRAMAAMGLGNMGNPAALPALHRSAQDKNRVVRKKSIGAISKIKKFKSHSSPLKNTNEKLPNYKPPRYYLQVKSVSDKVNPKTSWTRRLILKVLREEIESTIGFTSSTKNKNKTKVQYGLDISIMRMTHRKQGAVVLVDCHLRSAISNRSGKILSFVSGSATVRVPRSNYSPEDLPRLRKEAIENAVRSVHQDIVSFIRSRG